MRGLGLAVVVVGAWAASLARLAPAGGGLGHDWGYFLPQLLVAEQWFRLNGLFAVPQFTPAFCGGVPLFANPQALPWSLPQALFAGFGTAGAVWGTLAVSALGGAAGMGVLLRRSFHLSAEAAALGAVLFLFGGFLTHRLLAGHLTYHVFALVPWMAHLALAGGRAAARVAGIGLMVAVALHGGAANFLAPAGLMLAGALLIHPAGRGRPWLVAGAGLVLGLAIGAPKLAAGLAFLTAFPRAETPIGLFGDLPELLRVLAAGLFAPGLLAPQVTLSINGMVLLRHEFEMGVSVVPAALLIAWAARATRRRTALPRSAAGLAVVLLAPLAVTLGGEDWAAFLKTLPYVGNNAQMVRWWSVWAFLAMLAAPLAFERLTPPGRRPATLAALCLLIAAQANLPGPQPPFARFDPDPVSRAHRALAAGTLLPPIEALGISPSEGRRDALFLDGLSALNCYEPMFGYRRQSFPGGALVPGPALAAGPAGLNVTNPACLVWGGANHCVPGDPFPAARRADAAAFLAWRPFPFAVPWWQSAAWVVAALALLAALLALAMRGRGR